MYRNLMPRPNAKERGRILYFSNFANVSYFHYGLAGHRFFWSLAGDIHNLPASAMMAADYQVRSIWLTPTMAIILSDYLKDYPILKKSLKYLTLFGETPSPRQKELLQKLYPRVTIIMMYGTIEVMSVANQCEYLAKKSGQIYYHPRFDRLYIEIINPDTGEEVKMGEKGEIVVTSPYFFGTPIIRYKTGDLVSLKEGRDCPCGFSGPLLQTWGRVNYDVVRAGGFELRREFLEKAVDNLSDFLKDSFEAHIYENFENNKPKIRIELNFSLKKGAQESFFLRQKIEKEVLENWQVSSKLKLKKAIEVGFFEPVKINFVDFPVHVKSKKALILHQT